MLHCICYLIFVTPIGIRAQDVQYYVCALGLLHLGDRSSAVSEVLVGKNVYVQYQYQDSADIKLHGEEELESLSLVILFSPTHKT